MGFIGIQDGAGAAAPKTWWIINFFEEIWAIYLYLYLFFLAQTSDNENTVYICYYPQLWIVLLAQPGAKLPLFSWGGGGGGCLA
jgi:hypothetical protein